MLPGYLLKPAKSSICIDFFVFFYVFVLFFIVFDCFSLLWIGWDGVGMVWMWWGTDGMGWEGLRVTAAAIFLASFQVLRLIGRKSVYKPSKFI